MKAHKFVLRTIPLLATEDRKEFNLDELMESVILNSPPEGLTTAQLIKSGALYNRFKADKAKHPRQDETTPWEWFIEKDLYETLVAQLASMRWARTSPEVRLIVAEFIKAIQDSKETDVEILAPE